MQKKTICRNYHLLKKKAFMQKIINSEFTYFRHYKIQTTKKKKRKQMTFTLYRKNNHE